MNVKIFRIYSGHFVIWLDCRKQNLLFGDCKMKQVYGHWGFENYLDPNLCKKECRDNIF